MNLSILHAQLSALTASAPLVFMVDGNEIGAGYHITEFRHANATGIDCGGNIEHWEETRLQLLDGSGDAHMTIGKFCGILKTSLSKLPQLSRAPLLVEFSLKNRGLKLLALNEPTVEAGRVIVTLSETTAACKPAQRRKSVGGSGDACCSGATSESACCGTGADAEVAEKCCT